MESPQPPLRADDSYRQFFAARWELSSQLKALPLGKTFLLVKPNMAKWFLIAIRGADVKLRDNDPRRYGRIAAIALISHRSAATDRVRIPCMFIPLMPVDSHGYSHIIDFRQRGDG